MPVAISQGPGLTKGRKEVLQKTTDIAKVEDRKRNLQILPRPHNSKLIFASLMRRRRIPAARWDELTVKLLRSCGCGIITNLSRHPLPRHKWRLHFGVGPDCCFDDTL